jgi:hypothetical protein
MFDRTDSATPPFKFTRAPIAALSPTSGALSKILRCPVSRELAPITAPSTTPRRTLFNRSSSASPTLVSRHCATVRLGLPAAPFAAGPAAALSALLLVFIALRHILLRNMVRGCLRGHSDQQRYRKCGTGKPFHVFFLKR